MTINLVKCKVRITFADEDGVERLVFSDEIATYTQIEDGTMYRLNTDVQLQEEKTSKCLFDKNHKAYRICPHCSKELT